MPEKICHVKEREAKQNHAMNTTTCNAKTCLYFGNISILNKKDTFDNAKRIIHVKRKGNKTVI